MKLVRDKVPEAFPQNTYHVAEPREFMALLRLKLVEEAAEVAAARNEAELIEELGDLLEVFRAILNRSHLLLEGIESDRLKKRERLGGYSEGWVMTEYVEGDQ